MKLGFLVGRMSLQLCQRSEKNAGKVQRRIKNSAERSQGRYLTRVTIATRSNVKSHFTEHWMSGSEYFANINSSNPHRKPVRK